MAASRFVLRTVDGGAVAVVVTRTGAGGQRLVELKTTSLSKDSYVLEWTALSLDDGHPSSGSMAFGIGLRPATVPAVNDRFPGAPALLLRWLDLAAIMLAIGALAVSGRVLRSMPTTGSAALRRARRIGAFAACVAVVSGAMTPFVRAPRAGSSVGVWFDTTWATLTGTPWGNLWLAREVALAVAAAALWLWARRNASGPWADVAAAALVVVVGLEAWAGHAADLPRQSAVAALASAAHLAAAGVWAGGLVILAACVIPVMRRDPGARGRLLASVWRAFSPVAATAVVVLLATGLYESGRYIPDLSDIGTTLYGAAAAGKAALLVVALILAAFNTLIVNPRFAATVGRILGRPQGWAPISSSRFAAVAVAEVAVVVAAVGLAATLTSIPTSREVGAVIEKTTQSAANVDGLFVTFEQVPAGEDQTRLIVRTHSTVKPERGPITAVDVHLAGPTGRQSDLSLVETEPGRYEAGTSTLASGDWSASVAVQRQGRPDALTQADWTVSGRSEDGVGRLEFVATTVAFVLLAALAAALLFARVRRRRLPSFIPRVNKEPGR